MTWVHLSPRELETLNDKAAEPLATVQGPSELYETAAYEPINCEFHDVIESYATRREMVDIVVTNPAGSEQRIRAVVADVFSCHGEEFLRTQEAEKIRLDRIMSIGIAMHPTSLPHGVAQDSHIVIRMRWLAEHH